jgi:DNA (cytosine-5)-methyltransferase 1
MPLRFIDLFAGLGGFHFALEDLGHECVFASEIKEDLRKLYGINFPGARIEGDITKIRPAQIPAHDILCAGFPCQPFSQAGKRQGFHDEKDRGNLFSYICDILEHHRPRYVFLENVSNLMGHDEGNTWRTIKDRLENLGYNVAKPEILSPHQFGIPQHRRRIYIVCENCQYDTLKNFSFPKVTKKIRCDITKIIDETETDYLKLRPETRSQMAIWQEFIDLCIENERKIPSFPIWAMEFGANYDYKEVAPAFQTAKQLLRKKGKLGNPIVGDSVDQCLSCLPIYAQTKKDKKFPDWKIRYIEQNREFYEQNREWLDRWMKKIKDFDNSHLKMEWNCGPKARPVLDDKIIQFRASGIRVKLPTFSPALNLVGTQIPILPWVKLPENTLEQGEPQNGRYMTRHEAALLQGMKRLKFGDENFQLSVPRSYAAMGNAVNVTIVKHIAKKLLWL